MADALEYYDFPWGRRPVATCEHEASRGGDGYDLGFQLRFWTKVVRRPDCWFWTGGTNDFGYGVLGSRRGPQRHMRAHRVSWEMANGPIPTGACVLHRCDNPPCVNPDHLFLGTKKDNTQDMMRKGRHVPPPRVHLHGERGSAAKLTWESVRLIRAAGDVPGSALARWFGVAPKTVNDILLGKTWRVAQ